MCCTTANRPRCREKCLLFGNRREAQQKTAQVGASAQGFEAVFLVFFGLVFIGIAGNNLRVCVAALASMRAPMAYCASNCHKVAGQPPKQLCRPASHRIPIFFFGRECDWEQRKTVLFGRESSQSGHQQGNNEGPQRSVSGFRRARIREPLPKAGADPEHEPMEGKSLSWAPWTIVASTPFP